MTEYFISQGEEESEMQGFLTGWEKKRYASKK